MSAPFDRRWGGTIGFAIACFCAVLVGVCLAVQL